MITLFIVIFPADFDFVKEIVTINKSYQRLKGQDVITSPKTKKSNRTIIIIDTLKRVCEAGGDDYSYASDYDVVARLKALADSYKVTMLIVHHTRNQK